MADIPITGRCYCGAIQFAIHTLPIYSSICYCGNCRRAVGAQSVAWVTINSDSLKFVKGQPARFRTDTGAWRTFCSTCGTSLTYQNDQEERDHIIDVTIGCLDHPERFAPTLAICADERLCWEPLLDGTTVAE